tara:strand:- start:456 stop:755 length:300 start_codon:yes stop_codon:yes gene_type:complete
MKIIVDLCIVPIGVGTSLSEYIAECQKVITKAGLKHELHANGTAIEGEWDSVFIAIKKCHAVVHHMGAPRIHTNIKLGTRNDKNQSIDQKISSVKSFLN